MYLDFISTEEYFFQRFTRMDTDEKLEITVFHTNEKCNGKSICENIENRSATIREHASTRRFAHKLALLRLNSCV